MKQDDDAKGKNTERRRFTQQQDDNRPRSAADAAPYAPPIQT